MENRFGKDKFVCEVIKAIDERFNMDYFIWSRDKLSLMEFALEYSQSHGKVKA